MRWWVFAFLGLVVLVANAGALEKQPSSAYRVRREALGAKLQGGVAILFAAPEPVLDFMPYRQDSDFYYLTGWNEPGAALMVVGASKSSQGYREILFLPTRNLRTELYTGVKMDAATPHVIEATGVESVEAMTEVPVELDRVVAENRGLLTNLWTQPGSEPAKAAREFNATTLGLGAAYAANDVTRLTTPLREEKDAGEIELLKKASRASIAAQLAMMRAVEPGVTQRALAGPCTKCGFVRMREAIVAVLGSGVNSTTLPAAPIRDE